jgi:DNA segregation ATPase FtsK/SpoIIIE, S-DNA-T family
MARPRGNRRISEKERGRRGDTSEESTKVAKSTKAQKAQTGRGSGLARDVLAVVLLALGLGLFLALTTFSSADTAVLARGAVPSNLVGRVGHRTASAVYEVLGFSALVLPLGLLVVAWRLFRAAPTRITLVAAFAHTVLTFAIATLAHLALASHDLASFPAGGAVGAALGRASEEAFSFVGSVLLVAATATVALIVGTGLKVQVVAGGAGQAVLALGAFLWRQLVDAVHTHREAVAELRADEEADRARRAEAEAIAARAVVDAEGDDDRAEGVAVAGALALEDLRRGSFDDPAWVSALAPANDPGPSDAEDEEPPARKRRAKKKDEEAGAVAAVAAVAMPAGATDDEPLPPPGLVIPPPMPKPEIIVSQAMLDRAKKKKEKDKKDVPAFAFTKAGDVFRLPSLELLDQHEVQQKDLDTAHLQRTAEAIVATLKQHGVDGTIRHIRPGPVVTLYEFSPVAGVKLARIENLDKELTMALSAIRIRIIAPIPGKGVVGIEVPNKDRATVYLRDLLESETFANAGGLLPLGLGKNIEGLPYCVDLQRMPHLLIAGTTGSGKSVGLNTMILSLLYRQTPAEVRMIMIDPKMTELSIYENIPHLLLPVVTDPQKAARALQWAVDEMERRTQILADTGSKDLKSYNGKVEKLRAEGHGFQDKDVPVHPKKLVVVDVTAGETEEEAEARTAAEAAASPSGEWIDLSDSRPGRSGAAGAISARPDPSTGSGEGRAASPEFEDPTAPPPADPVAARDEKKLPQKLPYVVVVVDELADLMMTAPREVEISLARLAQKARATGIHLIVATQRPSTDVITGMIKNNFPARISFRLASRHDSQTIINGPGAESLLGDGDMLVLTATHPVTRAQGAFVSEEELHRVVGFLKEQGRPVYDETILKARDQGERGGFDSDDDDPTYDQAIELVSRMEEVSVSKLQREMRLGYNKAAKIVERMEREGIVGPPNGVKPRQVLIRPIGEVSPVPNV